MTTAEFGGVIGRDWRDSEPWWSPEVHPPDGAPNVALVVLDDVGYAQLGCYGSDIATPTLDRLAAGGVRLANFHTTALCSPTRSCLLTGRNHHANGMGRVADLAMGYPGYCGRIPRENGFLSEILGDRGYAPYAVGKWHLTPDDETHMAASRESWPLGRGFQRWYGFHGGETHQFAPALYHDNHAIAPPGTFEDGYHLSADLADQAIRYVGDLRAVDADRPWFLYFATGACHSPHHAPAEWIERYRGRFDRGWDVWRDETFARQHELGLLPSGTRLSPRPSWVPAWDELSDDERRVAARFMECFAAYLSYTDAQIGRLVDFVEERGELDDTLVVVVSDNGASAEGGRDGSINDGRMVNLDPAGPDELRRRIDEIGGPSAHNNYPVGLDDGRQHALPPLEAGGARGRRGRSLHRPLAGALRRERGDDPPPVRARHRRDADGARAGRHRGARADRSRPPGADRGHELRLPARRRTAPTSPSATRRSTSRCSARARSTTAAGRR